MQEKVEYSIPSQGIYLGCGSIPSQDMCHRQPSPVSLSHRSHSSSLSLFPTLPSKKKNQFKNIGGEQSIFAMSPQTGVLEGNARAKLHFPISQ